MLVQTELTEFTGELW